MTTILLGGHRPGSAGWAVLALSSATAAAIAVAIAGPIVAVALVVGLLALVVAIAAPGILFASYLLIAFYKGALQEFSPIDITVFLALANTAQAIPVILDPRHRVVSRVGVALWLSLGLMVVGGVLYAPDQSLALGRAVTYWALVILAIVPAALRVGAEPRYVNQFVWAFFGMGIVTVVLGLVELSSSDRLVVLGMNTVQVGRAALLVPLLGITWVLPQRRPLASVVTLVLIPASLLVAIASGSRGPLIVFLLIGVVGVTRHLARPHAVRWQQMGAVAALALASVVIVSVAAPNLPSLSLERFANLAEFVQGSVSSDAGVPGGDTSAAARVQLYQFAVQTFEQRPLVGAGTAGFEALSPAALGPAADTYPHNAILQVAAEFGLLGLGLFLGVAAIGLGRRLPGRCTGVAVRAIFVFSLFNAMVSGDIFNDRETLGVLLLILAIEAPRSVTAPATRLRAGEQPPPRWSVPEAARQAIGSRVGPPGESRRGQRDRSGGPQEWM
jgi:O-antigen ligase